MVTPSSLLPVLPRIRFPEKAIAKGIGLLHAFSVHGLNAMLCRDSIRAAWVHGASTQQLKVQHAAPERKCARRRGARRRR